MMYNTVSREFWNFIENPIPLLKTYDSEVLVAISVLLVIIIIRKLKSNFPPGPVGLPIVGYIPFLTKDVHLKFIELGKKYGDVFSLRLGSQTVVVLNGADSIKEAFAKPEFLGRPPQSAFTLFKKESPFFGTGMDVWREHRRFVIHSMKDLGLGKSRIEGQIQDEINYFLGILKSYDGKPMDLSIPLTPSMSNNIGALVYNERYEYDNPERKRLDKNLILGSEVIAQTSTHIFFPWLRYVPFFLKWMNLEKGTRAFKDTEGIFLKKIKEHESTLDPKNIRDYIDSYLVEQKSRKEKDPNTTLSGKRLIGSMTDLFGAGSETVRTTILWCVYVMAAYPTAQSLVIQEILEVLGPYRSPEYMDQKQMPFTHAVIMEVMRWKTVVPLNILRYTLADATVGGYGIPRDTTIMANFWAVHHDPKLWEDPESFKPARFLSPDGRSVLKQTSFMPFSVGKRSCPGENMANMEVFLYFTSILQKFDIFFPEGFKPAFDAELTVTYRLTPYLIRFAPRN